MSQTTIRPTNPLTETVADISISGQHVHISFLETNDKFREVIKDHGFSWGGFGVGWERKCTSLTGSTLDRATEICILLLKAGFIISIVDDTLKEKYHGEYEIQAYILNELFKQKYGYQLKKFYFVFLKDGSTYQAQSIYKNAVRTRTETKIKNVLRGVKQLEFKKKVSFACEWCDYKGLCI
ncbi:MAG: hypothetical protein PHE44_12375 [Proteiniphilum sp.]|nr:hypothetical protein [Proteiniphilum sp.]